MDTEGKVLSSITDDKRWPRYSSLDSEGHVFVVDWYYHHVLLLNSELQLQRVLIEPNSDVELWQPQKLCYNELTSELYVLHGEQWSQSDVVSLFSVH